MGVETEACFIERGDVQISLDRMGRASGGRVCVPAKAKAEVSTRSSAAASSFQRRPPPRSGERWSAEAALDAA